MFTILDGRNEFYQWDKNRKIIVNDSTIKQVHFANCLCSTAKVVETYADGAVTLANVPNVLLTEYQDIKVWGYDGEATKHCAVFEVVKRTKPDDYIFTDDELREYEELVERCNELDADIAELYRVNKQQNEGLDAIAQYATETATKLDNLEIGGRNRITSSDNEQWIYGYNNTVLPFPHEINGKLDSVHTLQEYGFETGDNVVFSADMYSTTGKAKLYVKALPKATDYNIFDTSWATDLLRDKTQDFYTQYNRGQIHWRYEAASSGYQFRKKGDIDEKGNTVTTAGNNAFMAGSQALQYVTAATTKYSAGTSYCWIAFRFRATETGTYNVEFKNAQIRNGANKGSVFIVPANYVDDVLGSNAKTYASAVAADCYQTNGSTDAFKAYKSAIEDIIRQDTPVMTTCYYIDNDVPAMVTNNCNIEVVAGKEYVVVFTADEKSQSHKSNAYIMLNSFKLTDVTLQTYTFKADEYTTNKAARHIVAFTIPDDCGSLGLYLEAKGNSYICYKELQAEKGNIPTEWKPVEPADYITAQGVSGDWTWRKWNSGLAECWLSKVVEGAVIETQADVGYYGELPAISFPVPFIDYPYVSFTTSVPNSYERLIQISATALAFGSTGTITALSQEALTTDVFLRAYVAGKWK